MPLRQHACSNSTLTLWPEAEENFSPKGPIPTISCGAVQDGNGWKKSPELLIALEKFMEFETAGDPTTELKWTRKTTEKLALQLTDCGFPLSPRTAGRLLYDKKYQLRVNAPCPL